MSKPFTESSHERFKSELLWFLSKTQPFLSGPTSPKTGWTIDIEITSYNPFMRSVWYAPFAQGHAKQM